MTETDTVGQDECFLCRRVTAEMVYTAAHKLYSGQVAREMAQKVCTVIRETYRERPTLMCGKSSTGLIAGLFYAESMLEGSDAKLTQRHICKALGCSMPTVKYRCQSLVAQLPRYESIRRKREQEVSR